MEEKHPRRDSGRYQYAVCACGGRIDLMRVITGLEGLACVCCPRCRKRWCESCLKAPNDCECKGRFRISGQ